MGNNDSNTSNVSKTENLSEKDVPIKKIRNAIGLFLIFLSVLLLIYSISMIGNRLSFNFKRIAEHFQQSELYEAHLIDEDYGLKRNDYIDFLFNVRTDDGSADCEINGRATKEGLEYVDVKGSSNICQSLIY